MPSVTQVEMDPLDHAMVAAALARLGFSGSWDRLRAGEPLADDLDVADAELLVAARILERRGAGYVVTRDDPVLSDGTTMANGLLARLRRAVQHAEGRSVGWDGQDADLVLRQGRASGLVAGVLASWLPEMPSAAQAFEGGQGRFLDVGVGVAAISIGLCRRYEGLTCVGLDVVPEVVALGRQEVADAGLVDRIELRVQSVADLTDEAAYDLAWIPQPFIPRAAYAAGIATVLRAVRPGGWLVSPVMTPPDSESEFERAVVEHAGHVLGGGPISVTEVTALLEDAGWVDVTAFAVGVQMCVRARRPSDP